MATNPIYLYTKCRWRVDGVSLDFIVATLPAEVSHEFRETSSAYLMLFERNIFAQVEKLITYQRQHGIEKCFFFLTCGFFVFRMTFRKKITTSAEYIYMYMDISRILLKNVSAKNPIRT